MHKGILCSCLWLTRKPRVWTYRDYDINTKTAIEHVPASLISCVLELLAVPGIWMAFNMLSYCQLRVLNCMVWYQYSALHVAAIHSTWYSSTTQWSTQWYSGTILYTVYRAWGFLIRCFIRCFGARGDTFTLIFLLFLLLVNWDVGADHVWRRGLQSEKILRTALRPYGQVLLGVASYLIVFRDMLHCCIVYCTINKRFMLCTAGRGILSAVLPMMLHVMLALHFKVL